MKIVITLVAAVVVAMVVLAMPPDLAPGKITGYFMTARVYDALFVYEIARYPAYGEILNLEVVNESIGIGLSSDTDALDFGKMPGNGSFSKKFILVNNTNNDAVLVSAKIYGNITPLISFDRNDFVLHINESAEIGAYFKTKTDNQSFGAGNYSGELDIVIKRPQYEVLYWFLGW